jgi:hypothetical protein
MDIIGLFVYMTESIILNVLVIRIVCVEQNIFYILIIYCMIGMERIQLNVYVDKKIKKKLEKI